MRASAIRHLAITDESSIVAAALFERTVQIWSWRTGEQLGEFETVLDFGGRRLALSHDGRVCFAAGWRRGLAAYSVPGGSILWHRRDIHKPQTVRLSGSGAEVYCAVEGSSAYVLEAATGETVARVRGAVDLYGSQHGAHRLLEKKRRYTIDGASNFGIPTTTYALLDAAFSPGKVCVSEARNAMRPSEVPGGVHLIDLATGRTLWRLDLSAQPLAFNSSDGRFYCVSCTRTKPHSRSLVRLAGSLLECDRLATLDLSWESAFTPSGRCLVTTEGIVYETSTGNPMSFLHFPLRDYPDPSTL